MAGPALFPLALGPVLGWPTARALFLLAALAAVLLGWAVHLWRVQALVARTRDLEALVAERTRSLEELQGARLSDPLTGLHNRTFLERAIEADVELATRRHAQDGGAPPDSDLVFLLIDIDGLERIATERGEAASEVVIQRTADVLRDLLRASDLVVRWSRDQFLVVARFVERAGAPALAEKLRAGLATHAFRVMGASRLRLTCSIGFAPFPFSRRAPRGVPWRRVMEAADMALFAAKRAGCDRCVGLDADDAVDPDRVLRDAWARVH